LLFLGYLALAAAVLLKGPIGFVLPSSVAVVYLLVEGQLPAPWRLRRWLTLAHELGLWGGVPLAMGLTLPMYLWADAQTRGEFFRVFWQEHNLERGFGGGPLRAHPWWFYGPQFCADFLPWSLFLPAAGYHFLRQGRWRQDPEARFGLVWLLTMMVVLSCARFKRADYLLPAFPGAALFLGCAAGDWLERTRAAWQQAARFRVRLLFPFGLCPLAFCLVLCGWWVQLHWILPRFEPALEFRSFAEEVRRLAPAPRQVVFFRAEAHTLAFHVGRPLAILVKWEDLDARAALAETSYVVMPARSAAEWPQFLKAGRLEEVLRDDRPSLHGRWPPFLAGALDSVLGAKNLAADAHERPLVLLRTRPAAGPDREDHARARQAACHCQRADQCGAAGAQ